MSSNKQQNVILRSLLAKLESHRVGNLIKMYYVLLERGAFYNARQSKKDFLKLLKTQKLKKEGGVGEWRKR